MNATASDNDNLQQLKSIARSAMLARGMQPDFSAAALAQLDAIAAPASAAGATVRDQRALLWCSIDNDDSRDLDQLSVSQPGAGAAVRILVAIADVDALVARDSAIDQHASANTTSVYTVPQIFPMLPEKLSTDLTSLADAQERLALVVDLSVGADGSVDDPQIYRALVCNRAKLAYNSVGAWLEGRGPEPARVTAVPGMAAQLRIQDKVAQSLRAVRHANGALTLQSLEAQPVFDGDVLRDLRPDESNHAQQLIEDFMIAANGVVARYLAQRGSAALRRVLRTPKNWDRIVALAAQCSERLPQQPSALALNAFLAKRRAADPTRFPDLSLSVIKLLGRGEYALDRPGQAVGGHFGLAVNDYTHSTAPNRRFPDLLTQRLIKAVLEGRPAPYSEAQLSALAAHCTQQEDNAAKIERQVGKSAAAMLLGSRIGATFDAIVTGASAKGTYVRISSPTAEGRVIRNERGVDVGDKVRVKLLHTDVAQGFIDFERLA